MEQLSPITSSIEDITLAEKSKLKFKGQETAVERVKRQKSEFFSLLTTQLKNQDPLAPMDTAQMTQQIFSINAVEQSIETNRHLEDIKNYFAVGQNASYMNYIDKIASFPSNTVLVENNLGEFRYELLDPISSATLQIRDSSNNVVHTEALEAREGVGSFMWKKPQNLPDGIYSFSIKAETVDGNPARTKTYGSGRISGIVSQEGKQRFEINGSIISLEEINKISNSTLGSKILSGIQNLKTEL